MLTTALLRLNFEEVRRRSTIVWLSIPEPILSWRPDPAAMSCIEMVRHVLEAEYNYARMVRARRSVATEPSPFSSHPLHSVQDELARAEPHRAAFLALVESFDDAELAHERIDRSDVGYVRPLGDFLLRIAYHEAVHCGQSLQYLRTAGVERPRVWD